MVRFILPMFFAIFLQTMYGAVDLLVVERFAENADAFFILSKDVWV